MDRLVTNGTLVGGLLTRETVVVGSVMSISII